MTALLAAALLAFVPSPARAQEPAARSLSDQLLSIPQPRNTVQDFAGLFLPGQREQIQEFLMGVQEQRRIRIFVVTIPDAGGRGPGQYAKTLREQWTPKAGERDRSAMILFAKDEGVLLVDVGAHLMRACTNLPQPMLVADLFADARRPEVLRAEAVRAVNACVPAILGQPPLVLKLFAPPETEGHFVGRFIGALALALVLVGLVFAFLYIVFRGPGTRGAIDDRPPDQLEAEWNRLQPLLRQRYTLLQELVASAEFRTGRGDYAIREIVLAADGWMAADSLAGQVEAANRIEKWVPHGVRIGQTHAAGRDERGEWRIARLMKMDGEIQTLAASFNRHASDRNEWIATQEPEEGADAQARTPLFTPARLA